MNKATQIDMVARRKIMYGLYREELAYSIKRSFAEINAGQGFLPNWHFNAIAYELSKVAQGQTKRFLITLPPRSLKSLSRMIAFLAWVLGHDPSECIIAVSYAQDLAAALSGGFRKIMASPWYRRIFPQTRIDVGKDTETETHTTKGGYRVSTMIGGSLTGRGGNLIVIDDPMKASDANSATQPQKVES